MSRTQTLVPLEPVALGSGLFYVDHGKPIGVWVVDGVETFVTWPDAAIPGVAFEASAFPSESGVWIVYSPYAMDLRSTPDYQQTAAYVEPDGLKRSVRLGEAGAVGSDSHGLWTSSASRFTWSDQGTLPPDWRVDLTRHNIDGTQIHVTFDRPVLSITGMPDGIRIEYSPAPPLAIPLASGGTQYKYSAASINIPASILSGGPLSVAEHESTLITDDLHGPASGEALRASFARRRLLDRPSIPAEITAEWPMIDRSDVDVRAVTARALYDFRGFSRDFESGSDSGRWSDSDVELRGEWPEIDLVVYFDYSAFPGTRFRYVLPLFEQGGRPALNAVAADNFIEDLNTRRFVPPIGPVGEYIDF